MVLNGLKRKKMKAAFPLKKTVVKLIFLEEDCFGIRIVIVISLKD